MLHFFLRIVFLVLLTQLLFGLSSCNNDDSDIKPETEEPIQNELRLSRDTSFWYLREKPDSIVVMVEGGKPPYAISKAATFSSNANIQNDSLIIYPKPFQSFDAVGLDTIAISDSSGTSYLHILNVKTLRYTYSEIEHISLAISGDTSFNCDTMLIRDASWDAYTNVFFFRTSILQSSGNQYLTFWVNNIDKAKMEKPKILEYTPNSEKFPDDYRFVPIDTLQQVNFTQLSESMLTVDFGITAKESKGKILGNFIFSGNIKLAK